MNNFNIIDLNNFNSFIYEMSLKKVVTKINYSYIMIKPDGAKYIFATIYELKKRNLYDKISFFKLNNWKSLAEELYEAKNEWTKYYYTTFLAYSFTINELFGNTALVILIENSSLKYEDFLQGILEVKNKIRESRDGKFALVTNAKKIPTTLFRELPNTIISLTYENNDKKKIYSMPNIGFHDFHALNILHSPDKNKDKVCRELNILKRYNVFTEKNIVNLEKLKMAEKFNSLEILNEYK